MLKEKVALDRTLPFQPHRRALDHRHARGDGKIPDGLRAGSERLDPACSDLAYSPASAQFEPTDRAGGTIGYCDAFGPAGLGTDEFAGAGAAPSDGAPGNCTGSRMVRSFDRRLLVHPVTSKSEAAAAARRNVVFISHLLRE
jgi:hypothetical protein